MVVGGEETGKNRLFAHFAGLPPSDAPLATVSRILTLDDQKIKLSLWDIGMQAFSIYRMSTAEYRGADGLIVVYDAGSEASLLDAAQWLSEAERFGSRSSRLLLGNNAQKDDKKVTAEKAQSEAQGAAFIEVNSDTGAGAELGLRMIAKDILARRKKLEEEEDEDVETHLEIQGDKHASKFGLSRATDKVAAKAGAVWTSIRKKVPLPMVSSTSTDDLEPPLSTGLGRRTSVVSEADLVTQLEVAKADLQQAHLSLANKKGLERKMMEARKNMTGLQRAADNAQLALDSYRKKGLTPERRRSSAAPDSDRVSIHVATPDKEAPPTPDGPIEEIRIPPFSTLHALYAPPASVVLTPLGPLKLPEPEVTSPRRSAVVTSQLLSPAPSVDLLGQFDAVSASNSLSSSSNTSSSSSVSPIVSSELRSYEALPDGDSVTSNADSVFTSETSLSNSEVASAAPNLTEPSELSSGSVLLDHTTSTASTPSPTLSSFYNPSLTEPLLTESISSQLPLSNSSVSSLAEPLLANLFHEPQENLPSLGILSAPFEPPDVAASFRPSEVSKLLDTLSNADRESNARTVTGLATTESNEKAAPKVNTSVLPDLPMTAEKQSQTHSHASNFLAVSVSPPEGCVISEESSPAISEPSTPMSAAEAAEEMAQKELQEMLRAAAEAEAEAQKALQELENVEED